MEKIENISNSCQNSHISCFKLFTSKFHQNFTEIIIDNYEYYYDDNPIATRKVNPSRSWYPNKAWSNWPFVNAFYLVPTIEGGGQHPKSDQVYIRWYVC